MGTDPKQNARRRLRSRRSRARRHHGPVYATDAWLMQVTGAHPSTVRRWRARRSYPLAVRRLAELELQGNLGLIHPEWEGWIINRDGVLVTAEGWTVRPGEIRGMALNYQRISALERELKKLREKLRAVQAAHALPRIAGDSL